MQLKNKVTKEIRNKGAAFLLVCAVISSTTGPVMAAVAHAVLTKDVSQVTSPTIGNTTGEFSFALSNSASSDYQVEAIMYAGARSNSMAKCERLIMAKGQVDAITVKVSQTDSVANVTAYGNTKDVPRTGCIATARIENK